MATRETQLLNAAAKGDYLTVAYLLQEGGLNVNAQDARGKTALLTATQGETLGHNFVIKALLRARADVKIAGPDGTTPLLSAACAKADERLIDTRIRDLLNAGA